AVSRAWHTMRHNPGNQGFLAVIGLFLVGGMAAIVGNVYIWFGASPADAVRDTYHSTVFSNAISAAEYIAAHTRPGDRIAVLGSEPEIYFYSRRRSVTGYIYMYPLMEEQPYAATMQADLISDLERTRPEY